MASAARSRRTAWGPVTAPTSGRGPAPRGRTSIASRRLGDRATTGALLVDVQRLEDREQHHGADDADRPGAPPLPPASRGARQPPDPARADDCHDDCDDAHLCRPSSSQRLPHPNTSPDHQAHNEATCSLRPSGYLVETKSANPTLVAVGVRDLQAWTPPRPEPRTLRNDRCACGTAHCVGVLDARRAAFSPLSQIRARGPPPRLDRRGALERLVCPAVEPEVLVDEAISGPSASRCCGGHFPLSPLRSVVSWEP